MRRTHIDIDVGFSDKAPRLLTEYPAWATIGFSAAAVVLGGVAHARKNVNIAAVAGLCAMASLAFLGLAGLLGSATILLAIQSHREFEESPGAKRLDAGLWPDKALAASVLLLVAAIVQAGWGIGLVLGTASLPTFGTQPVLFGVLTLVAAALSLLGSYDLYMQRTPWVALAACLAAVATLAAIVVAPLLGAAALWLTVMAWRENEFGAAAAAGAPRKG